LQGLQAAQGLHGLAAAQGLQALQAAAQGLQVEHAPQDAAQQPAATPVAAWSAHEKRGTSHSSTHAPQPPQAPHGLQAAQGLHGLAAAQGLQAPQAAAQGLQAVHAPQAAAQQPAFRPVTLSSRLAPQQPSAAQGLHGLAPAQGLQASQPASQGLQAAQAAPQALQAAALQPAFRPRIAAGMGTASGLICADDA